MNPEEIAAFFESRKHRVVKTASCWWYDEYHQDRIYQSFPIHRLVTPEIGEIRRIFSRFPKAMAVRFVSPTEAKGQKSFIWVCRRPYDLVNLSSNTRSHVRRGMKNCQVRSVTFDELGALGREAHRDTTKRHAESEPLTLGLDSELDNCSAYEAWGAFVEGHLAAYLVTLWVEDWVHILLNRSTNAYLRFYPNNALIFSVVKELLSREGVQTISYGVEPLIPIESLERFKLGMGFMKEPVSQRIMVARWLKPLINSVTCRVVETAASWRPHNPRLQKVAGICRIVRNS